MRRPKGEEGNREELVRESPDKLTLRAEEVGTWKSCINVDHIAKRKGGVFLWWILIGTLSAKLCTMASQEKTR